MSILHLSDLLLVLNLRFLKLHVVVLVEVLVLLNMGLLNFFLALLMGECELLVLHVKLLLFQLQDPVLGHFRFDVPAVLLAHNSVLFHGLDEV